jgi:uncharacterized repeat protein (TIGR01451 family)
MQKSIWKLAALAGVIGVGFLGVMQAQRGLSPSGDDNTAKTQFEDFDSSGQPEKDADTFAGKESDNEIDFGQFEPIDENDGRGLSAVVDHQNSEFQVADAGANDRQSDPFAEPSDDFEPAAPDFDEFFPQKSDDSDADSDGQTLPSVHSGRDDIQFFPKGVESRLPNLRRKLAEYRAEQEAIQDGLQEDEPLDDGFRPIADDDSATKNVTSSAQDENSSRPPFELTGRDIIRGGNASDDDGKNDDGDIVRQVSQPEPATAATKNGSDDSDNPFADDGPRLFAPADDTRSIDEPAAPKFGPQPAADAASDGGTSADPVVPVEPADGPFRRLPRIESPQADPKSDDLPQFDGLDEFQADPLPVKSDDSPIPDPDAFDEEPKTAAPSTTNESALQDDPAEPPFGLLDDAPAKSQAESPQVERVPFPTIEPKTAEKSPTAAAEPTEAPNRLTPYPKAVRLVPPTDDDLAGDATIGADAPRGIQRPQLSIVKQAPPKAVLGQSMIYSIIVKNIGDSPAVQVTVEDHIPRGTKLTGTIPQAEMYKKTLVWKLGTLKPNEERKIQVRVVPFKVGQIGSIATVNFVTEVAARTLVTSPSLKLDVASPARANVGGRVTLTFKVTNNGTSKATGVVLRNLLPSQLSHPGGNDLEYQVGDLAAGQSKDISLQLTAAKPGKAISKAVITADGNLNAEATASIDVVGAQLELTRSGPKRRHLGRAATYINRVTNKSGAAIGPITIVETIPAGLKFVKATNGGQFNQVSRTIAWQIDTLAAGESQDVRVELTATSRGTQLSQVTATGPEGVEVRVESKTDVVGLAALSANLTGITGPLSVGKTVTLQVRVANRGNEPATGVKVQLELSDQLTFVTSDGPVKATASDGRVIFAPLKAIGPQEEQTLTIVLKAIRPGEARLKVQIDADQLSRPLTRDDALVIIDETP